LFRTKLIVYLCTIDSERLRDSSAVNVTVMNYINKKSANVRGAFGFLSCIWLTLIRDDMIQFEKNLPVYALATLDEILLEAF